MTLYGLSFIRTGPRVSCSSRYLSIECCRGLVHFCVPASSVHFSHVVPTPQCYRLHPYLYSHYNHDVTEILPYGLRLNLMQVHSDGSVRFGVTCGDRDYSYGKPTYGHVPIKTLSYQISSRKLPLNLPVIDEYEQHAIYFSAVTL